MHILRLHVSRRRRRHLPHVCLCVCSQPVRQAGRLYRVEGELLSQTLRHTESELCGQGESQATRADRGDSDRGDSDRGDSDRGDSGRGDSSPQSLAERVEARGG